MDAVKFLKTKGEMTQKCGIGCCNCPFSNLRNGKSKDCTVFISEHPEEAVKIVENWLERYEVSYKDDFFKQHPNTPKDENGDPKSCRRYIYGGECPAHDDCHKCWNEIKYVEGYEKP